MNMNKQFSYTDASSRIYGKTYTNNPKTINQQYEQEAAINKSYDQSYLGQHRYSDKNQNHPQHGYNSSSEINQQNRYNPK